MKKTVNLKDYTISLYRINEVILDIDLYEESTSIKSVLIYEISEENAGSNGSDIPLVLDGERLKLKNLSLNGRKLTDEEYRQNEYSLTILDPPCSGKLTIEVEINPQGNTELMGLYRTKGIYCTQNEAAGFRRMTYFLDRPDILSVYTTTIRADKKTNPYLLSNGNLIASGNLPEARHFATWHDPFPKPCYLFALVAGNFGLLEDNYVTGSGRNIALRIFVDKGKEKQAAHVIPTLKNVMRWDENRYGLEYDLDTFMIAAVNAFNNGAMENKGLNIYNSSCILADRESVTDQEMLMIKRIIAHEYLHNWTGNRVTCRDWFQLSIKEGLTVYRDEEYISDQTKWQEIRIDAVRTLKEKQYAEDAGPLAHPVQPASYLSIDNFYTATVYQKGKELIRMIETITGREKFLEGFHLYIRTGDGKAATVNDFVNAMEKVSGHDLGQFRNWYSQAGTPECIISGSYDTQKKEYTVRVRQDCRPTAEKTEKEPFHIPLKLGLIDSSGKDMALHLKNAAHSLDKDLSVLHIRKRDEIFVFTGLSEKPVPSLFRDFSAPVKLRFDYSMDERIFLMRNDSNPYNRYEAAQQLAGQIIKETAIQKSRGKKMSVPPEALSAFAHFLNEEEDTAFRSRILQPPALSNLAGQLPGYDVDNAFEARRFFKFSIAKDCREKILSFYSRFRNEPYSDTPDGIARRSLKNLCLGYLVLLGDEYRELAFEQYLQAGNMTDSLAALSLLADKKDSRRDRSLHHFYDKWKNDSLVINKWFAIQAGACCPDVLNDVKSLENNPLYDSSNPNKVRSLYAVFSRNLINFHNKSGAGYRLITDQILKMDSINPHVAAGLSKAFEAFNRVDQKRQALMRKDMERVLSHRSLSDNVYEVMRNLLQSEQE